MSAISGASALTIVICLAGPVMTALPANAQDPGNDDAFERQRTEMLDRQRRVILNNDGGDALRTAPDSPVESMLTARTLGLEETHVDTIFYCTNRGTFSRHSHRTEVSEYLVGPGEPHENTIFGALVRAGTDPLEVMVQWGRENDVEIFWSERMNDQHDASRPDGVSAWKREHPECLVGSTDDRPPHGAWSQVDYAQRPVRDQMFSIIEEVCLNYDIDGIEMDFFRHPTFFRTTAWGGHATDEEIALMTGLVRRVREMTERVGRQRGRPILVAIRVPDSVPLARAMGLDLEGWLAEGLVDIMTGSGYFRMNSWEYLVELGRRHGALVYAGLSESRVDADTSTVNRRSQASYRGRAARAWQAGVDGIYLFNMFNPRAEMLQQIGDPEVLAGLDAEYFATVRGAQARSYGNPDHWVAGGSQWRNVPILTPEAPLSIAPGESARIPLFVGDQEPDREVEITCHLMAISSADLRLKLNGREVLERASQEYWTQFPIAHGLLRPGENSFELTVGNAHDAPGRIEWTSQVMPQPPWRHGRMREGVVFAELQDDGMLIADRGTEQGDYLYFSFPWNADPERLAVAEAQVRVIDGWNNLTVSNGIATERVALYPDHIRLHFAGNRHEMDTTREFHTYRVEIEGENIRVYVDGELRIDGTGAFTHSSDGRNSVAFGAANSPSVGEALWRSVSAASPGLAGAQIYDLAVCVSDR